MNKTVLQKTIKLSVLVSLLFSLIIALPSHTVSATSDAPTPSKVIKARLFTNLGIVQYLRLVGTHTGGV